MHPLKDSVKLVNSGSKLAEGAAAASAAAIDAAGSDVNEVWGLHDDDDTAADIKCIRLLSA